MPNQYVNKVVQSDGTTLIDITDTTSVASDVKQGTYFYLATGEKVQGSAPGTYSVTLSLNGASSSATGTKVVSGGSYFTELTPTTSGHKISSITVTMGGVDITSQVFKPGVGGKAITANGTYNASSDNLSGYDTVTVNVSGGGGGTPAISVVDTTDTHGGTIREITALDISDTTAVAADVAQGKYFYTAEGVKTQGTGSGGALVTETGTFTGSNGNITQISCDFEPREIYIRGDLTGDVSLRGIVSFTLIKDRQLSITNDTSTSNTAENAWIVKPITGYNQANSSSEPYASYSNDTLIIDTVVNSSGARFPSGVTYDYTLIGLS